MSHGQQRNLCGILLFAIILLTGLGYNLLPNVDCVASESHSRQIRKTACSTDQFKCDNGECINRRFLCNGPKDCADGSDETLGACKDPALIAGEIYARHGLCVFDERYTFCDYGACVRSASWCNGTEECADGSDEKHCDFAHTCESDEFKCVASGDCVPLAEACDGFEHCEDASDETRRACDRKWHLIGRRDACRGVRCDYGACALGGGACDGIKDCPDNTDEKNCISTDARMSASRCTIPEPPEHGYLIASASVGPFVRNGTVVHVKCHDDYSTSEANAVIECLDGEWRPAEMPLCYASCPPPVADSSVELTCTPGDQAIEATTCDRRLPHGSTATARCRAEHSDLEHALNRCVDGRWDGKGVPSCLPRCGESTKLITLEESRPAEKGQFPWHVVIYSNMAGENAAEYKHICGGTLVDNLHVITAAHCFYDNVLREYNNERYYLLAFNKIYTAYDSREEAIGTEYIRQVKKIDGHGQYRGISQHYQADLAVLTMDRPLTLNEIVQPICMNLEQMGSDIGLVAGMGGNSKVLRYLGASIMQFEECYNNIPADSQVPLTMDKICAKPLHATLASGDSGGGLVFKNDTQWYLQGVVSLGHAELKTANIMLFTNLFSDARKFLSKVINPRILGPRRPNNLVTLLRESTHRSPAPRN